MLQKFVAVWRALTVLTIIQMADEKNADDALRAVARVLECPAAPRHRLAMLQRALYFVVLGLS